MKKYFRPELTISSFEAEDIMVVSGTYGGEIKLDGINFENGGSEVNLENGAIFSWK